MKNRKGFTLIEILSVIIILGIIMIIAVPAVSKYILKSDKAVYVTNANAFVETVRGKYEMKEYGPLLNDDQIMIVPIESVILEKGTNESPYGRYEPEKSYVVIVPEKNKYSYYATIIDETNTGIIKSDSNIMSEEDVKVDIVENVPMVSSFETVGAIYEINGKEYKRIETREIIGEDVNQGQYSKVYVFKDITIEPEEQTGIAYTITLNNKGATTPGTTKLYELYTVGWYRDIQVTTMVKKITAPYKNGYEFLGYYTEEDGKGTQIITQSGLIIAGTETIYKSDGTMYAKWVECGNGYYSENSIKCTICPEGYRDGEEVENKVGESACLKNVEAGKHVAVAKAKDAVTCEVNTFANKHTVTYGNTSPCPACTTLGSGYTKSPGGTGETGCYMTLTAGQYVKNKKDKTASSCPKNYYSKDHTVNYGQLSVCTSCTVLGMYYTQSEGGTGETGCYMTVAAGKYKTSSQGMITANCAANKYSEEHRSYYKSSDENSCKSCPTGYTCTEGSTTRTACKITCSANTRVTTKDGTCSETCVGGTTIAQHTLSAGSTSAVCSTCSNNTGVYQWSSACNISTCKAGYGKSGNSCVACAAGTTSSNGNTGCSRCSNSSGVASWSSGCNISSCSSGYYKSGNSCVYCSTGVNSSGTGCKTANVVHCTNPSYNGYDQSIAYCDSGSPSNATRKSVGSQTVTCAADGNHYATSANCSITGCNRWECDNCGSVSPRNQIWHYYDRNCNRVNSGWVYTGETYVNPDNSSNKAWFYFENGAMKTGWLYDNGCWFFLLDDDYNGNGTLDGGAVQNQGFTINGSVYYFNNNAR